MKYAVTHLNGYLFKTDVYLFETEKEAKDFLKKEFEKKTKEYVARFGENFVFYSSHDECLAAHIDYVWEDRTSSVMDQYWFGVVGDVNSPS